ncbi:sialidase family protein [Fimbriimonas ginsengisoli]|uniref:Glycosyl hydrolase, BNR repeat-containing protein n=1 Tax=Fimbriimonas ginsengisoli Gsoil 348 TaxID=661478 RepID=A0A068NJZ3_FIMGI|nr:sialidase family protein [Fimbriimonas ginsengisoli]AIE83777.1 glycosyl hydrolase, BNR repeat-containing protein [Fimbriimonas ginsengisoli Gsoil 348]
MPSLLLLSLFLSSPSEPVLVTPAGFLAREPQVAVSGRKVFVACGNKDRLFVVASENGGQSYSPPVALNTPGSLSLGMRRGPRIAVANGVVVVSAVYGKTGGGRDGELLSWRSTDSGRTWSGPAPISDVPGAAREGLHAMAASGDGKLAAAWLDLREGGTQIWASTSNDAGATWSKNLRVYRSPDGHVCECCHPSLAFGPKGELYVMFRNWLGGSRDMYLSTSVDGGRTFDAAQKLGAGTWPLNACPMDGGALAVEADGRVTTAWRRDGHVFTCVPGQPEIDLGEGTQPWVATTKSGTSAVWLHQGEVRTLQGNSVTSLGSGGDPVIASSEAGSIAAWADENGRIWSRRL